MALDKREENNVNNLDVRESPQLPGTSHHIQMLDKKVVSSSNEYYALTQEYPND